MRKKTIHTAVKSGDFTEIKEHLNRGVDINQCDEVKRSPLHIAVSSGRIPVVKYLLENKASMDMKNGDGDTALHLAASDAKLAMVKELLSAKASLEIHGRYQDTPVHSCLRGGNDADCIQVVEYLIEIKPELLEATNDEGTPLQFAVGRNQLEVVKFFLRRNNINIEMTESRYGLTLLGIAAKRGHFKVVEYLIEEHKAQIDAKDNEDRTPLYLAVEHDHIEIINYFITKIGIEKILKEIYKNNKTLLHVAAEHNSEKFLNRLKDYKVSIDINIKDAQGLTPLYYAARYGAFQTLELLLIKITSPSLLDNHYKYCLNIATEYGNEKLIRSLIDKIEDITSLLDKDNNTYLHYAARHDFKIIKIFLEPGKSKGLDINFKNKNKQTPLYIAALYNQPSTFKYLKKKGAEIDWNFLLLALDNLEVLKNLKEFGEAVDKFPVQESTGNHLLHEAAKTGKIEVAKFLVENDHKSINTVDSTNHFTPLHLAYFHENNDIVSLLLENKADTSIRGYNGKNPLEMSSKQVTINPSMNNLYQFQKIINPLIDFDKISFVKSKNKEEIKLGAGGQAEVFLGNYSEELGIKRKVAIKCFKIQPDSDYSRIKEKIVKEARTAMQYNSNYVVQVFGVSFSPTDKEHKYDKEHKHQSQHYYLIMEYSELGSLRKHLHSKNNLSVQNRYQLSLDICNGLKFLHSQSKDKPCIIHRDLKSANILLFSDDHKNSRAKLGDLGLAIFEDQEVKSRGGTQGWMAPEIRSICPSYTTKSDIYSLGLVLLELWGKCEHTHTNIESHLNQLEKIEIRKLIAGCIANKPAERPEIDNIISQLYKLAKEDHVKLADDDSEEKQINSLEGYALPSRDMSENMETITSSEDDLPSSKLTKSMESNENSTGLPNIPADTNSEEIIEHYEAKNQLVLMTIIDDKQIIDTQKIIKILTIAENKSFEKKPILIKQNDKFIIFGLSEQGEWKLTGGLDALKFKGLRFDDSHNFMFELMPVTTKADGDCALHAILGELDEKEDQLICANIKENKDKIRAAIVSQDNKQDMKNLITDGIKELVMSGRSDIKPLTQGLRKKYQLFLNDEKGFSSENWSRFEAVLRHLQHQNILDYIQRNHQLDQASSLRDQFYDSLNKKEGELYGRILSIHTLHEAFQEYNQLQNTEFDWVSAISGEIKEEYAEFLGREHVWLLPSELAIIAYVFDKTVNYYPDPNSSFCLPLNPGKQSTVTVQFNGINHYERLESRHYGKTIILANHQIPEEVYEEIILKKGHNPFRMQPAEKAIFHSSSEESDTDEDDEITTLDSFLPDSYELLLLEYFLCRVKVLQKFIKKSKEPFVAIVSPDSEENEGLSLITANLKTAGLNVKKLPPSSLPSRFDSLIIFCKNSLIISPFWNQLIEKINKQQLKIFLLSFNEEKLPKEKLCPQEILKLSPTFINWAEFNNYSDMLMCHLVADIYGITEYDEAFIHLNDFRKNLIKIAKNQSKPLIEEKLINNPIDISSSDEDDYIKHIRENAFRFVVEGLILPNCKINEEIPCKIAVISNSHSDPGPAVILVKNILKLINNIVLEDDADKAQVVIKLGNEKEEKSPGCEERNSQIIIGPLPVDNHDTAELWLLRIIELFPQFFSSKENNQVIIDKSKAVFRRMISPFVATDPEEEKISDKHSENLSKSNLLKYNSISSSSDHNYEYDQACEKLRKETIEPEWRAIRKKLNELDEKKDILPGDRTDYFSTYLQNLLHCWLLAVYVKINYFKNIRQSEGLYSDLSLLGCSDGTPRWVIELLTGSKQKIIRKDHCGFMASAAQETVHIIRQRHDKSLLLTQILPVGSRTLAELCLKRMILYFNSDAFFSDWEKRNGDKIDDDKPLSKWLADGFLSNDAPPDPRLFHKKIANIHSTEIYADDLFTQCAMLPEQSDLNDDQHMENFLQEVNVPQEIKSKIRKLETQAKGIFIAHLIGWQLEIKQVSTGDMTQYLTDKSKNGVSHAVLFCEDEKDKEKNWHLYHLSSSCHIIKQRIKITPVLNDCQKYLKHRLNPLTRQKAYEFILSYLGYQTLKSQLPILKQFQIEKIKDALQKTRLEEEKCSEIEDTGTLRLRFQFNFLYSGGQNKSFIEQRKIKFEEILKILGLRNLQPLHDENQTSEYIFDETLKLYPKFKELKQRGVISFKSREGTLDSRYCRQLEFRRFNMEKLGDILKEELEKEKKCIESANRELLEYKKEVEAKFAEIKAEREHNSEKSQLSNGTLLDEKPEFLSDSKNSYLSKKPEDISPKHNLFFKHIRRIYGQECHALWVSATNLIKKNKNYAGESRNLLNMTATISGAASGEVNKFLPGAGVVFSGLSLMITTFQKKKFTKQLIFLDYFTGMQDIEKFIESLARRVVQRYQLQIDIVANEDLELLARCAVNRFLEFMAKTDKLQNYPDDDFSGLAEDCLRGLVSIKLKQGTLQLVDKEIRTNDHRTWTESGIFQKPGIIVSKENSSKEKLDCFYVGADCNSEIYGFCYGTIRECEERNLKLIDNPTPTPEKPKLSKRSALRIIEIETPASPLPSFTQEQSTTAGLDLGQAKPSQSGIFSESAKQAQAAKLKKSENQQPLKETTVTLSSTMG
jgi:ankyrin repeat protein/serine/threonine protein kinase